MKFILRKIDIFCLDLIIKNLERKQINRERKVKFIVYGIIQQSKIKGNTL